MKADKAPMWLLTASLGISALVRVLDIQTPWLVYSPWILSVVLWGLPHGAADHVVWSAFISGSRRMLHAIVRYVAVMVAYAGLWTVAPVIAMVLFLGMTVWHWGSADAYRSFKRIGAPIQTTAWFLASLSRGLVPVVAPLVCYRDTVSQVIVLLSPELTVAQVGAFWPSTPWVVGVLILIVAVWLVVMRRILADLHLEAFESALVVLLLVAVHPIASVGVYFTFWHATGHVNRLRRWYSIGWNPFFEGRNLRWDQTGIMVITWVGLACVWSFLPMRGELMAFYLMAIAILTLPHMVVVWKMDSAESGVDVKPKARSFGLLPHRECNVSSGGLGRSAR
ncbi:MAG: Brp/Blh family beta-carotene 15,15'-dioxygenase [Bacteroidetes bacterium]|nr:Brp/Blh family beta-carotene 15,15'-dioxygenase [Bacteroidota bacterium]